MSEVQIHIRPAKTDIDRGRQEEMKKKILEILKEYDEPIFVLYNADINIRRDAVQSITLEGMGGSIIRNCTVPLVSLRGRSSL